jgi:urease beta subunit
MRFDVREASNGRPIDPLIVLALIKVLVECDQTDRALDQLIRYIFSPSASEEFKSSVNTTAKIPHATNSGNARTSGGTAGEESWLNPIYVAIHALGKNLHWDSMSDMLQRCHFIAKGHYAYQSQHDHELASIISVTGDSPITSDTSTIFHASTLSTELRYSLSNAMPHLFDSAARTALRSTTGLHHAIALIQLQKNLGILPTYSCVR